jgi:hypothetical protein
MQQDKLIIILADISGYTHFMVENRVSAVHGQICINSLIEAILSEVDIPLTLQEIEGDAVFLYAREQDAHADWQDLAREISMKLTGFFDAFLTATGARIEATPCACAICRNADKLGLKVVVHAGEAIFHELAGRAQVSGADVILAHRLLKNSIASDNYMLLTEPAYKLMSEYLPGDFAQHQENYDGFEPVDVHVRILTQELLAARDAVYEASPQEMQANIDTYLGWVGQHTLTAAWQQVRSPIRAFSLGQRLLMLWDSIVGIALFKKRMRIAIPKAQLERGERRTEFGKP